MVVGGWGCLGVVQLGWGYWEEGGWVCLGVVPLGWVCFGEGRELQGDKTSRQARQRGSAHERVSSRLSSLGNLHAIWLLM
jgi:hypothetical protein